MRVNPILNTDSYKTSHFLQYPPGTTHVSSYIEARPVVGIHDVVFFGLQMFIKEYLTQRITAGDILEAEEFCKAHGVPFNRDGWLTILKDYDGYLPVRIDALPEGTVIEPGTPMVQVVNTDPRLPWLTSYLETAMLRAVWYPSTVATNSREVKKTIWKALLKSSDDPHGQIPFKLHDFGARGTSSFEQAGIGGCAHLVNFMGSDTMTGVLYARKFYGEDMAAYSIPAAEHSTMTSWGQDREIDAYRNMLTAYPSGLVAVVSDSYDIYNAIENIWGDTLRDDVLSRDGVLVVRPDSGNPLDMVMFALETLGEKFGVTENSKGFKVLHPKVRVIQGDGVDPAAIKRIVDHMVGCRWSMDNVAFGMGAGLLQHVNRDTLRFAMKASAICGADGWYGIQKLPKSDMGKASKRGIQYVCRAQDGSITVEHSEGPDLGRLATSMLQPAYNYGKNMTMPWVRNTAFADVRNNAGI